jgi:UDP-2,4-diacetamido-2,4,6-trideoxy-beta-L-altropyranose hydrolase
MGEEEMARSRQRAPRTIVFRVDAGPRMGGGHVMRCLTLADALSARGAKTTFVCAALPVSLLDRLQQAGHEIRRIPLLKSMGAERHGWEASPALPGDQREDAALTLNALGDENVDWVVVDHYLIDWHWQQCVRHRVSRICVIDDLANRVHDCDILLDQTLGRQPADYAGLVPSHTHQLLGPAYALIREEFQRERPASLRRRRAAQPLRRLLISLGSTDIDGITAKVTEATLSTGLGADLDVVIGADAESRLALEALTTRDQRVHLHIDSRDLARLGSEADLAIGAAGTSSWERCALGLPTLTFVLSENQLAVARALAEAGAVETVASTEELSGALTSFMAAKERQLSMVAAAAAVTDGSGAGAVAEKLIDDGTCPAPPAIAIRPADWDDAERLWVWRNDPTTRAMSQTTEPLLWAEHEAWFQRTLTSHDRYLFVAELGERPVGMVRFDALRNDTGFEVSINVAAVARGGGTGTAILAAGCRRMFEVRPAIRLEATIRADNERSRRAFEALGFRFERQLGQPGWHRYVLAADGPSTCQNQEL